VNDPQREPFIVDVLLMRDRIPSFDQYPYSIPAVRHLNKLDLHPKVTYFIGENGTGKSTLLEAIALADGFNPEGGTRNFRFATRETHSDLGKCLRLGRSVRGLRRSDGFFFRAESFYNVASEIDRLGFDPAKSPYGPTSLHEQSHGESFLTIFVNRLTGDGLYLFDEPESALSPQHQLMFLAAMHHLIGRDAQLIIATHSPIIMAYPEATIYEFSAEGIRTVEYKETESYRITKAFLTRTEMMLDELLSDE